MQKSLAACQGKTVPGAVQLVVLERRVPGGGKSRKRTAAGGRPRILGSAGGAAGSMHGLSLRVDTLSTLSPMRSVKWWRERRMTAYRTVVQRLERRYVAVPPHKHCRCAGEVVGQMRQRPVGGGGVVSSGGVFGSTQCFRKLV